MNLENIGSRHGTDKVYHGYMKFYESYFGKIRNEEIKLMEIGVYKGSSIKTWEEYFPKGLIFGIDDSTLVEKSTLLNFTMGRIKTFMADQKNRKQLESVISDIKDLDIIIDDGLHYQEHQQVSLGFLFKFLKNKGLYIIEDLCPRIYTVGTWGIRDVSEITTNILENFCSNKKISSPYMTPEEMHYLEEHIESINLHYISNESIIAFIRKK